MVSLILHNNIYCNNKFACLKLTESADGVLFLFLLQIKRSDSAFFWEEREIMANANSEWIVQVGGFCDSHLKISAVNDCDVLSSVVVVLSVICKHCDRFSKK